MPKIILRCNYLKNAPPSHLANYMNYISTRKGVEKVDSTTALLPATEKQKELIADILSKIEDAGRMHEYYDYLQKPTRENASEFITQALENNLDIIAKKKNFIDYLANRPRVEKIGTHGLFSNEGESVVLSRVAEEAANHPGVVWINVISLRREDAERLGYDSAAQWQALLRSRVELLCENYKIDSRNLKWYAAFHNESHHPHVHLVVYSTNPSEGYLTKKGIETMRSCYAHDIFRQEFMSIYEKKNEQRERLKEQANKSLLFLLGQMQAGICHNERIAEQMQLLSKRLMNTGGKKVYGYLKADVKAIVNGIVDELAKEERVAECYRTWLQSRDQILEQVYQKTTDNFLKSKILLTMIPDQMKTEEIQQIENQIVKEVESGADTDNATFLRDKYFIELGFDRALVRTTDFNALCDTLKGRELASLMDEQMKRLFEDEQKDETIFKDEDKVRDILKRIHDIAYEETTAEGTASANMLVTSSIKEMVKNFKTELPRIVVSGAKGSGKTYIYKQLLQAKTWENFIEQTGTTLDAGNETVIIPLLASVNSIRMKPLIEECMEYARQDFSEIRLKKDADKRNYKKLMELLEQSDLTRTEWVKQWFDLITGMFQGSYADISELDKAVANSGKRCATDKYKEIRTEMRNIYEILEKFERMKGIKTLPLTLDKIELTGDEISKLEAQGYLRISDEKYYLPEIIRLPLGFTYERGARPKVLSLLVQ